MKLEKSLPNVEGLWVCYGETAKPRFGVYRFEVYHFGATHLLIPCGAAMMHAQFFEWYTHFVGPLEQPGPERVSFTCVLSTALVLRQSGSAMIEGMNHMIHQQFFNCPVKVTEEKMNG